MIFKVVLDKKIHLVKLAQETNIHELKKAVSQAFKLRPEQFTMFYVDEEGDDITLNDEHDYAILVSSGQKAMKVKVVLEEGQQIMNETSMIEEKPVEVVEEKKPEPIVVEEEMIEEKLKKLLPGLVAKVKTEIEEEVSERSRIYDNQPLIVEDDIPNK